MLAAAPFDWQLNDSYFVVAHFHYTLVGGMLFMSSRPSITGSQKPPEECSSETLGKWHFWLFYRFPHDV